MSTITDLGQRDLDRRADTCSCERMEMLHALGELFPD